MSKAKTERALGPTEAKAVARHLRTSRIKLNLVAQMIRGMDASRALTQLTFSDKRIALAVKKALQSAIANAENNHNLNVDALYVKEAFVGKNMVLKRMHTRGRGRSAGILKPFSDITIVVSEREQEKKKPAKAKKTEAKKPASKKTEAKKESK